MEIDNEYASLVASDPQLQKTIGAPDNDYGQIIAEQKQEAATVIQRNAYVAAGEDPDRKAQAIRLAQDMKLPVQLVERNFDSIKKDQEKKQFGDYAEIVDKNPGLAKWLQDPDNLTLAKDDMENLRGLERTVQEHGVMSQTYAALQSGIANVYSGVAKVPALAYDMAAWPQNAAVVAMGMPERQVRSPDWLRKNAIAERYDQAAKDFGADAPLLNQSITENIGKGNYSDAAKGILVQFASSAPQQAALIASALSGAGAAGLAYAGVTSAAQANAENQAAGISPLVATGNALAKGSIEAGFESLGTFGILKKWEGAIAQEYGKTVSREVMKKLGKTFAYSFMGEANEEALTSVAQDFTDYVTGVNPEALTGIAGRAMDAGLVGGLTGVAMTAPAGAGAAWQQQAKIKQTKEFYASLGEGAQASKLRERMPEAQRMYVEQITKDTPVENIYIPADAVTSYFQSNTELANKFMQEVGATEQFNEAQETGADIKIPLAQWVSKVVGTEYYQGLANDVKFSPDDMTANEYQKIQTDTQNELKKVDDEAKAEADRIQSEKNEVARKAVEDSAFEKISALGLYDDKTARTYAQFMAKKYEARAQNRGKGETADQLWKMANVELNRVEPGGNMFTNILKKTKQLMGIDQPDMSASQGPASESNERSQIKDAEREGGQVLITEGSKSQGAAGLSALPFSTDSGMPGAGQNGNSYNQSQAKYGEFKVREDMPAEVNVVSLPESALSEDRHSSMKEAKIWASNNLRNQVVRNAQTGWDIGLPQGGFKKVSSGVPSVQNTIALTHIDQLIKDAVFDTTETVNEKKDKKYITAYHRFYAPLSIGEKQYLVRIKIAETLGDKKFYHEVAVEKEIPVSTSGAFVADSLPAVNGDNEQIAGNLKSINSEESGQQAVSGPSKVSISQFAADINGARKEYEWFQGKADNSPRGRIRFKPGIGAAIDIFAGHKDLSTILHESGHLWLDELIEDATTEGVPEALQNDLNKVLKWVGSDLTHADGAAAIRKGITVEQHEQMARGFEAYLMEGRAPTAELRKIFAKFKVWFTSIYKTIANLNVVLDDDIRGVMDRLIAGDEAITKAEVEQNYQPLFMDPVTSGMNEAQAAKYNQAIAAARQASEETIRTKLMAEESKERKALLKEKSKEMRVQVTADAQALPIYQMMSVLETGLLPGGVALPEGAVEVKLSRASIVEVYGEQFVAENFPKKLFSEDGLPYDMVAEAFGYTDGEAMVQELANTIPIKEYIETKVKDQMAEAYPDLLTDGTIADEAVRAVHNDKRAQMLRMELEHLATYNMPVLKDAIKRVARRVPTEKQIREQATAIIAGKSYAEMKPYIFQRAEIKAAKEAGVKLAQGDIVGAFEAKKRELLNHELFRAATDARERVEKDRQKFKKMFKKDEAIAKTRDVDMVNAGRAILAQFGLTSTDKTAAEYLEPIKKYDPETYDGVMALVASATERVGNWKEVSHDDFVAMSDAVQAIWDLAKSSREMEIDGIKIDREEIIQGLSERLAELTESGAKPGADQALTEGEKKTMGLLSLKNLIRRVEHWATAMDKGDINGVFTKYIVRPVLEATTKYRLAKVDAISELAAIVKTLDMPDPKKLINANEIGYKFTKPELIMALLHTGNESNFRKLLAGRGWGSLNADKSLDSSRWQQFVARAQSEGIITQSDMDVVQKIWDLNEKLKPDAQKAHKRMYGYYFNEITANAVQTPWGSYRGGYMPAISDPNLSVDASIRAGGNVEESAAQMFPTTGRGFTKSREENYTTPLSLDFGKIASHLDKVLRFTYVEPAIKDVTRLVNDRGLRKDLNMYEQDLANDLLIPWLERAATQRSNTAGLNKTLDRALNKFRRVSSIQFMVLNATNAIQNFTGFMPAMTRVGPASLAGSVKRYLRDTKGTSERILAASDYMRTRAGQNTQDLMRDIDDVILSPSKYDNFRDSAVHHGYILERVTNGFMEMVVWNAAHNQAVSEGMNPKDAVNHADATVRQTQMAANPEDIARYESSSPFVKLFSMFSGFFNTQGNLLATEIARAREDGIMSKAGAKRAGKAYALVIAAPAIVTGIIARVMGGVGLDEDDDGELWDDFMDVFFLSQAKYMLAMVPGGNVVTSVFNQFNDKAFDDKINLSPASSLLEKAFHAPMAIKKAVYDNGSESKAIKESAAALGLLTGLPIAPLAKPAGYVADVKERKAKPKNPVDFTRGLVTGRPGN